MVTAIVASAILASATPPPGVDEPTPRVAVLLQPPPAACLAGLHGCAVGLLVPGAGATVTRAGALASLERGKVRPATIGDVPKGPPVIRVGALPGRVTFYVTLPPPGRHHNVRRYPIAVVGPGWDGILVSGATRIPGLVSVADIAPAVKGLEAGKPSGFDSRADPHAVATLRRLDARLAAAHSARGWATVLLVMLTLVLAGAGLLLRRPFLARAAILAPPAMLLAALCASALGWTSAWAVTLALLALGGGGALLAGLERRVLPWFVIAFLTAELVILAAWPTVNSLAAIGPHPDGGGRFYGVTNEVETLLLAPILAAAALLGEAWLVPLGVLALVAVGWSRAGADGGGVLVLLVGLAVLALRLRDRRLGVRRLAVAAVGVVAVAFLLVGIDAATGGSSHVTHAVGSGPGSLAGDLAHRLRVSLGGATASLGAIVDVVLTSAVLLRLATLRPRHATVDALLAALAVSLLVNDTPTDILGFGALTCAALVVWERVRP